MCTIHTYKKTQTGPINSIESVEEDGKRGGRGGVEVGRYGGVVARDEGQPRKSSGGPPAETQPNRKRIIVISSHVLERLHVVCVRVCVCLCAYVCVCVCLRAYVCVCAASLHARSLARAKIHFFSRGHRATPVFAGAAAAESKPEVDDAA